MQGGHVPFLYDADLNAVGDSSYTETLEANIRVIGQFLDKLKQSDLYDNSVIIVMADHGFDPQNEVSAYDRQNPLFLVKGVGESHPLQTSLVPAAYEDLQDAYVRLMDGAAGDAIFMRIQNTSCMNGYRRDRHGILTHIGRRGTNIPARIRDNPCFELFGIYSKRLKMGVVFHALLC